MNYTFYIDFLKPAIDTLYLHPVTKSEFNLNFSEM